MVRRRHGRSPGRIRCGSSVAISIRERNRTHRAPKVIKVFGFEARDGGVCLRNPYQRHGARVVGQAATIHRERTVVPRLHDARRIRVKASGFKLRRAPQGAGGSPPSVHFVEVGGVSRAVERRRWSGSELRCTRQRERLRKRIEDADWIDTAKVARRGSSGVGDCRRPAIVSAQRHNGGGDFRSHRYAARLGVTCRDRGDEVVVRGLVLRRTIREQTLKRTIGRGSRGRFLRSARCRRCRRGTKCLVRTDDGVNRVINGDVNRG